MGMPGAYRPQPRTPAFQWIIGGYHKLTALKGSIIEPVIAPAIAWVKSVFDWHLVLDPIWRPLFLLFLTSLIAAARSAWSVGNRLRALG